MDNEKTKTLNLSNEDRYTILAALISYGCDLQKELDCWRRLKMDDLDKTMKYENGDAYVKYVEDKIKRVEEVKHTLICGN